MNELDKSVARFKEAMERDERINRMMSAKYRGTFKDRSGLSDSDFQNRKSIGKYSWK